MQVGIGKEKNNEKVKTDGTWRLIRENAEVFKPGLTKNKKILQQLFILQFTIRAEEWW